METLKVVYAQCKKTLRKDVFIDVTIAQTACSSEVVLQRPITCPNLCHLVISIKFR